MTITVTDLKIAAPRQFKGLVTEELASKLNRLSDDKTFNEDYRENILTYSGVLENGKWSFEQYLSAVRFTTLRIMGYNIIDSWKRTFPDKVADAYAKGTPDEYLDRYASSYSRGKLVVTLMQQAAIPFHLENQDYRREALMVQVQLMQTADSEKVRCDAANSVLTHTAPPKDAVVELKLGKQESSELTALTNMLAESVAREREKIIEGTTTARGAAEAKLVYEAEEYNE